jgi:hypothetical protein
MYRQKTPKCQKPDKEKILTYRVSETEPKWKGHEYLLAAIDVGYINLALVIERRNVVKKTIHNEVYIVSRVTHVKAPLMSDIVKGLSEFLRGYLPLLLQCHVVTVEKQMSVNYKANRAGQHIITWLLENLRQSHINPFVVEFEGSLKYTPLGCPRGVSKEHHKKVWGPEKAISLLSMRGDTASLAYIKSLKKQDDLADVVLINESLCLHWGIMLTSDLLLPVPSTEVFTKHIYDDIVVIDNKIPIAVQISQMQTGVCSMTQFELDVSKIEIM